MGLSTYFSYMSKLHGVLNEIKREEKLSLTLLYVDYLWCYLRHGCLINQYHRGHFYKTPSVIRRRAFTQRRLQNIIDRCNSPQYVKYLEDKSLFNTYFKEFIRRKWLHSKTMTKEEFYSFYNSVSEIFIKPLDDMEGHGIKKLSTATSNVEEVYSLVSNRAMIIESCICQHPNMNFGNSSVNSARILTVLDNAGRAHVVRAGLRAGIGDAVVDNFSAGGVLYQIDIESGRIDNKGIQGGNYNVLFHPGTDICMLGSLLSGKSSGRLL